VTTSSCAGRVSVFLEGRKSLPFSEKEKEEDVEGERKENEEEVEAEGGGVREREKETKAGVGGKGGGGRWLFVSHDAVDIQTNEGDLAGYLGMQRREGDVVMKGSAREVRFIHFKFEPMVSSTLFSFYIC